MFATYRIRELFRLLLLPQRLETHRLGVDAVGCLIIWLCVALGVASTACRHLCRIIFNNWAKE
jgi:hypothetical protein